jgi:hypothetical protein
MPLCTYSIAGSYVTMRYVLYVMKNLYKLSLLFSFLYGVWRIFVVIRPSEPEALERVSISVHSCSIC